MLSQSTSITCNCGASYARVEVRLPIKDIGIFECRHCGEPLEHWHGKLVPKFTLIAVPIAKATKAV